MAKINIFQNSQYLKFVFFRYFLYFKIFFPFVGLNIELNKVVA